MARCFAFPQPGYVWNGETGDVLITSLKIRKEKIAEDKKRKEETRKRRRERKKRKQAFEELEEGEIREEEEEELEEGEIRKERHSHKHKKHRKEGKQALKATSSQMNEERISDMSEASNVTQEHDQAMCWDSLSNADSIKGKLTITSAANESVTAPEFSSRAPSLQDMNMESQWEKLISALPFFRILPPEPDDQEWLFRKKLPRTHTSTVPLLCPQPSLCASLVL